MVLKSYHLVLCIIYAASVSCSPSQISYSDHCSTIVPEPSSINGDFATLLFTGTQNGYCNGGERILRQDSSDSFFKLLALQTRSVYRTEVEGVFRVEGSLNLQSSNTYYYGGDLWEMESSDSWAGSVTFLLHGFWSESSGKLCMVGTGSAISRQGELLDPAAVLKLDNVKNRSTASDMVKGTLESLNSVDDLNYFEPISILVFPQMNYKYTLVSGASSGSKSGICSILSRPDNWLELDYPHDCYSSQSCCPSGEIGCLPHVMNIRASQCSWDEQKLQIMIKLHNVSYVSPNMTLIGEGWWDAKYNRLRCVACRILNTDSMKSLADAYVGDCSIRLNLIFPAIWSIRSRNVIMGQIWSSKTVDDSGYFKRITFQSSDNGMPTLPGLRYQYTEIERAASLCQIGENKRERFPKPNRPFDMQFNLVVKNSKGVMGWGSAVVFFVGDNLYDPFESGIPSSSSEAVNISYKISFILEAGAEFPAWPMKVDISAEGVYDSKTGALCMVGCRRLSSVDCEILINLQFYPLDSKNQWYVKGRIESRRQKSDPLYFNSLDLSSSSSTEDEQSWSIGEMEMEIILILLPSTLTCFFLGLQLLHVKNNPAALPSISLFMLVILLMNFESLFLGSSADQDGWHGKDRWYNLNNLLILASFLLESRLLQLALSVRLGHKKQKGLWAAAAEKNTLCLSLPLYVSGCLISILLNSIFLDYKQKHLPFSSLINYQLDSLWRDLRSCSAFVLDWFLLPQIILNLLTDSRKKALSEAFYIGITCIRLIQRLSLSNESATTCFYSIAWNAMVCSGSLLFCVLLFLQQNSGDLQLHENVKLSLPLKNAL